MNKEKVISDEDMQEVARRLSIVSNDRECGSFLCSMAKEIESGLTVILWCNNCKWISMRSAVPAEGCERCERCHEREVATVDGKFVATVIRMSA